MERDIVEIFIRQLMKISTHTLTWSVTLNTQTAKDRLEISTHTLTWSVTYCFLNFIFYFLISTHTLTWSVTVWNLRITIQLHISTHTLTWSVTDRHIYWQLFRVYFNSHAHVERDCRSGRKYLYTHGFQLTRSRGA